MSTASDVRRGCADNGTPPLISVVIPVYNSEKYLAQCVRSVLGQTYGRLELLLVDDGSADGSGELCDSLARGDGRIRVLHQENMGVSAARNRGLREARGELIGFVDSDDAVHPELYSALWEAMRETGADVVSAEILRSTDPEAFPGRAGGKPRVYDRDAYLKKFLKIGSQEIVYYVYNKLYRREVIPDGVFPEGIAIGEDTAALFRILTRVSSVAALPDVLYGYRQQSGVTAGFSEKYFRLTDVWDGICAEADRVLPEYSGWCRTNRQRISFTILSELAISGEYRNPEYAPCAAALLGELKKNRDELLSADIAWSRKLMIRWFCADYRSAAAVLHRFVRKRQ